MFGMEPRLGLASAAATAGAFFLHVDLAIAHCKVKNAAFPGWVLAALVCVEVTTATWLLATLLQDGGAANDLIVLKCLDAFCADFV
jgi:hypothetical protein